MKALSAGGWRKSLRGVIAPARTPQPVTVLSDSAQRLSPVEIRRFIREERTRRSRPA